MFQFIIASNNEGKIKEFRAMLGDLGRVMSQREANIRLEPEENAQSFEENALKKAKAIFNTLPREPYGTFILADDSGICVDVLGGEPGVRSARYASKNDKNATDEANRYKLIQELKSHGVSSSPARFVACVALVGMGARGERIEFVARGECEGRVIDEERGKNGFGYDRLFIPDGLEETLAEVAPEIKNRLSHRYRALLQVRDHLAALM
ncbi:non-canonical purine NTP pyrophosphatase [Helicobacter sp.]|uniref:non-canonical purine NTP pyrophosphatase n=1 Tax=Helicobacter sp. TaxID=218 RepID=UPI00388EA800